MVSYVRTPERYGGLLLHALSSSSGNANEEPVVGHRLGRATAIGALTSSNCHTIGLSSPGTPPHAKLLSAPRSIAPAPFPLALLPRRIRMHRSLRRSVRTERWRETPGDGSGERPEGDDGSERDREERACSGSGVS